MVLMTLTRFLCTFQQQIKDFLGTKHKSKQHFHSTVIPNLSVLGFLISATCSQWGNFAVVCLELTRPSYCLHKPQHLVGVFKGFSRAFFFPVNNLTPSIKIHKTRNLIVFQILYQRANKNIFASIRWGLLQLELHGLHMLDILTSGWKDVPLFNTWLALCSPQPERGLSDHRWAQVKTEETCSC